MTTRKAKAAELGRRLSGRDRSLIHRGMGGPFTTKEQEEAVEHSCQIWLDSWVIPVIEELLPKGEIRGAFVAEVNEQRKAKSRDLLAEIEKG
jgi:hypothetical protein